MRSFARALRRRRGHWDSVLRLLSLCRGPARYWKPSDRPARGLSLTDSPPVPSRARRRQLCLPTLALALPLQEQADPLLARVRQPLGLRLLRKPHVFICIWLAQAVVAVRALCSRGERGPLSAGRGFHRGGVCSWGARAREDGPAVVVCSLSRPKGGAWGVPRCSQG